MKNKGKYFLFNKKSDYDKGICYNIVVMNNKIVTQENVKENIGFFISTILDSKEKDTTWHRMRIKNSSIINGATKIHIYSANQFTIKHDGQVIDIEHILQNQDLTLEEKKHFLKPFFVKSIMNPKDILLHEANGRYMWFIIEFFTDMESLVSIEDIQIYFPKQTWISYLPEVYQSEDKNNFLERYLSIFQSLYDDLNFNIKNMAAYFEPDVTEKEMLSFLLKWIGEDKEYIWNETQQRYLLKNAMEFYEYKGTVSSIKKIVKLYTGSEPYIVEHHQLEEDMKNKRRQAVVIDMYGNDEFRFHVIVKETEIKNSEMHKTLMQILKEVTPAHMEANIIVIRSYIFLNNHSYLGINSTLKWHQPIGLNEVAMIPFATVG